LTAKLFSSVANSMSILKFGMPTRDGRVWAAGRSEPAREANRLLDKIGASLTRHYREIVNRDGYVSAEKVKNANLGMEDMRCETLLKIYERHNEDFEKMVPLGSRSPRTFYKYQTSINCWESLDGTATTGATSRSKRFSPYSSPTSSFSCARRKVAALRRFGCI
jgi:hypothetical protein